MYCIIPTTVPVATIRTRATKEQALDDFKRYLVAALGWTPAIMTMEFSAIQDLWYSKFGKHLNYVEVNIDDNQSHA